MKSRSDATTQSRRSAPIPTEPLTTPEVLHALLQLSWALGLLPMPPLPELAPVSTTTRQEATSNADR